MVAYLKGGPQVRTYSNYLRVAWEVEKEDSMEFSQSPMTQVTNNTPKQCPTSFFPLQKLKGNKSTPKAQAMHLVHLEEEGTGRDEDEGSDGSDRIKVVTEEFMVCLARAVMNTQTEEKHHFHCSSQEHFICNCPLMKILREKLQINGKEGTASKKGAWTPPTTATTPKNLQTEVLEA